jgi:NADH-quinone oxidoreductase subunit H
LFLGGWRAPWPISLWDGANEGWWPVLWFTLKVMLFLFVFIWLRGTLPRLRYDQFMRLGWKVLIPVALGWLLMVATVRALNAEYEFDTRQVLIYGGIAAVVLIGLTFVWDLVAARRPAEVPDEPAEFDPMAGGHPVPPLPGQQLPELTAVGAAEPSTSEPTRQEDER